MSTQHSFLSKAEIFLAVFLLAVQPVHVKCQSQENPPEQNQKEWVVYATEIGWLRVGDRDEFLAKWQKKDDIWGGNSEEPLQKTLVLEGFLSREQAIESLCSKLAKVQLHIAPPSMGAPVRYLSAMFNEEEFNLRLTEGFDSTAVEAMSKGGFFRGLEYDWEAEYAVLLKHNITPRYVFPSKQWLIHAIGRGTTQGPEELDLWMCFTQKPDEKGFFTIPLENGTTQTFQSDISEGPFRESFTLGRVMKKYNLTTIDLWPPVTSMIGRDVQPRVEAEKIPENPKDYGDEVLPRQPLLPNKDLEDWVIYEVEGGWLHVGTRYEFLNPVMKSEVIWAGTAEEPAKKTLLGPPEGEKYYSYQQALAGLSSSLSEVTTQYHPLAEPRETVNATFKGTSYKLRLERGANGADVLEYRSLYYDFWGNWKVLADLKITPRRTFPPAKLVHATGHGTYSGPVKDDLWMLVSAAAVQADGKSMVLPDGMGGTFGYSIDFASPEVKSNYELSPILRSTISADPSLKSRISAVGIVNEDRSVRADEVPPDPQDHGGQVDISQITLIAIKPDKANQGVKLGLNILASGIQNGCQLDFGAGVEVNDLVYAGRDADTEHDQWWCTLEISNFAAKGKRLVTATNVDGGLGTLSDGFEITKPVGDLCSPIRLVVPVQAPITVPRLTKQLDTESISVRSELQTLVEERDEKQKALNSIVQELVLIEQSEADFDQRESLWKERHFLEKKIREIENKFSQLLARCAQVISEEEYEKMRTDLFNRVECLSEERIRAIDAARELNVFYKYTEYTFKEKAYEAVRDDFFHTLQWQQHLSSLKLLKIQEQIKTERFAMMRDSGKIESKKLRPLQKKLKDIYVDMGRVSLLYSQANIEDLLFQQDTYLAAWHEVTKQSKNIEEAESLKARTTQRIIFGLKYVNSLAYGLVLGGAVDVGKRFINSAFSYMLLTEPFANTVSKDISNKIMEARNRTKAALSALDKLRRLPDEEIIKLKSRDDAVSHGLQILLEDRLFIEQTSGGLLRLAACYDVNFSEMMDSEFSITIQHAQLNSRDMRTTLYLAEGATPSGEYERWKRALTNPIGTANTFMQNSVFDRFSGTELWVANRETQARQMADLQTLYRKMNYETDIETLLGLMYNKTFQIHQELQQSNPDYLQFLLEYRRLAAQNRMETILHESAVSSTPVNQTYFEEMIKKNYRYVAYQNSKDMASLLQFQGLDRMMIWDFDGALECFYQAYEIRPELISFAKLEELRQDFAWMKTVNAGTETAMQLGNLGLHTALFAWMGNNFGEFFGIAPAPSLLQSYRAGQLSAAQFVSGFADFVWLQVNPFAGLLKTLALQQQWGEVAKALSESKWLVEQTILTQDILTGSFLWLGIDREYADFLANILVNSGFHRLANQNSVIKEAILKLRDVEVQFNANSVDIRLWNQRQTARQSFFDEMGLLKSMRELDEKYQQLQKEQNGTTAYEALCSHIGLLKNMLLNKLVPITEVELQQRFDLFNQRLDQIGTAPEAKAKRLKLVSDFIMENPLDRLEPLVRSSNPNGMFYRDLCQKVDLLRRYLVNTIETNFLAEHPEYRQYFEAYIHNGSWAHPDLPGYKYLTSDLDLNILVKRDTPSSKRTEIKNAFDKYFREQTGMPPEAIKMTTFVDVEPVFRAAGEDLTAFFAYLQNAETRTQLHREIGENLDALIHNLGEGERYFLSGSLFYLQFMNKFCGVKRFVNGELVADRNGAQIYQNLKFAPWMGFDLVMGQLPFINKAKLTNINDHVAYMKQLDKYALRVLLGIIVQLPRGLHELHRMDMDFVLQAGGVEAALVKLVEKIGRQPDPLKPSDAALSEQAALRAGLSELGLSSEYMPLLKEWVARKEGKPLQEVFEERAGRKINDPNDPRLNAFTGGHIVETEAFIRSIAEKTILGQATFLKQLENAFKSEKNPETQQVIKDKMLEILYSQAAIWKQLGKELQNWILKNSPPEAEYWLVIAELERIRTASEQSNWDLLLKAWQPMVVVKDDMERNRLKEEYQRQAQTSQTGDLLNSKYE